jgi:prolipoprotein diacylglyceryltransferase
MFNPEHYQSLIDIFQISEGRAIQGAIFFGGAFLFIYTTWIVPDFEFRKIASIIVPHVLLAQAIGR